MTPPSPPVLADERTLPIPLGEWLQSLTTGHPRSLPWGTGAATDALLSSGVAAADLAAFAPWCPSLPSGAGSADPAWTMVKSLNGHLCEAYPDLSLRDAVGWLLIAAHGRRFSMASTVIVVDLVQEWAQVSPDLVESGWRFAAAGLSPWEALDALTGPGADHDTLVTLARLRGCPIPA